MNYSADYFRFFKPVNYFMRFLRNDKFAGKVVTNCGENKLQLQYQISIGLTTNSHKFTQI
jgi:hypothetical protein